MGDVYNRPECIFNYCPDPDGCQNNDRCSYPTEEKEAVRHPDRQESITDFADRAAAGIRELRVSVGKDEPKGLEEDDSNVLREHKPWHDKDRKP